MFTKLLEIILQFVDSFFFVRVVYPWQQAIVLRLGKYHRTLKPGFHFLIPFHIEERMVEHTVPTTTNLAPQSLTTRDGASVLVSAVLTWRVTDVRKVLLEVEGKENILIDAAYGLLARAVANSTWEELTSKAFLTQVARDIRRRGQQWGIHVMQLQLSDLTKSKTLRVLQHGAAVQQPIVQGG